MPRGAEFFPAGSLVREGKGEDVSGQAGRSGAFARIAAEGAAFLLLLQLLAVPAGGAGGAKAGGSGGAGRSRHLLQPGAADRPHGGSRPGAGGECPQGRYGDHLFAGKPVRGDGRGGGARPGGHPPARLAGNQGKGKPLRSLAVRDLRKRYRNREAVKGVSLGIAPGEVVGLLGPNGAGKTTIFYMMVGLVRPDAGNVLLNGEDITRMPMHRRARMGIGYPPQGTPGLPELTGPGN